MPERLPEQPDPERAITGPETELDREAQPLGDGVEKNQLHPPQVDSIDLGENHSQQHSLHLAQLEDQLDQSLTQITPNEPHRRFSENWFLRTMLTPYLNEYPLLASDVGMLLRAKCLLRQPLKPPEGRYMGVFEEGGWAAEIRDKQLRALFDETWPGGLTQYRTRTR